MSNRKISQQARIKVNKRKKIQHAQFVAAFLIVYDIVAAYAAYFGALWLRFDLKFSGIPDRFMEPCEKFMPVFAIICIAVFWAFRLYRVIWRFASFKELENVTIAWAIVTAVHIIGISVFFGRMPISYFIMGAAIHYVLIAGIRFSYRFLILVRQQKTKVDPIKAMVIGMSNIIRVT